jgi:hypothetical protein
MAGISDEEEIQITYLWSKSGKPRTIPVWFTVNEGKVELLPMYGFNTKWFADVEKSGTLDLRVKDWSKGGKPTVVKDQAAVEGIKRRFGAKYGEGRVKRYYPTSDVALELPL